MKITVILTSYNHEKFIKQSIDSVLNQTYQNFEFIIVDDCSSDSSWDIICEYKKKYPQIITIRHEYNWRGGTVEDVVKNHATGDYIALHHSDDIWDQDKLQKQVDAMQSVPGCVAVFTNAEAIDDDGNKYADENGFYYNLFQTKNRSRQEWLNYFFYQGNCLCHPSILIRKDIYEEDGFFRKGLRQIPDFVKWIQVCRKHEIYVLSEALVKFRVHAAGKNASGMRAETQIRSTVELFLMLDEYAQIKKQEEFLKVFPEAAPYCRQEAFIPEYALGRICTQENMQPYTRLYGVELLYHVLNDPAKAELLKVYYQYTMQDLMEHNGKYDVFGILPEAFEQMRTIYLDTGNGYNADEMHCQKFTLGNVESFEWMCQIELEEGRRLKALRFDPVEGVMTKVRLDKVLVNGVETSWIAENALCDAEDKQIFVNLDPIYAITIPEQEEVTGQIEIVISGEVERLTNDEINQVVTRIMYEKRDTIYDYQKKLYETEETLRVTSEELKSTSEELRVTSEELRATSEELRATSEELNSIKTSRIYRVMRRFIEKNKESLMKSGRKSS